MNIYEGIEAYKTYLAIRNHFKTDYDYFKYNGKLKITQESFLKRRDKFFFAKLERKYKKKELVYFFAANFIKDENMWSGSLVGAESEKVYLEWLKYAESLKYNFRLDCEKLQNELEMKDQKFNDLFTINNNSHPILLSKLLGGHISIETFSIMDIVLNFTARWNKVIDDFSYDNVKQKVAKYKPFLPVDKDVYKEIMRKVFTS
jgi:hypothetical protein